MSLRRSPDEDAKSVSAVVCGTLPLHIWRLHLAQDHRGQACTDLVKTPQLHSILVYCDRKQSDSDCIALSIT